MSTIDTTAEGTIHVTSTPSTAHAEASVTVRIDDVDTVLRLSEADKLADALQDRGMFTQETYNGRDAADAIHLCRDAGTLLPSHILIDGDYHELDQPAALAYAQRLIYLATLLPHRQDLTRRDDIDTMLSRARIEENMRQATAEAPSKLLGPDEHVLIMDAITRAKDGDASALDVAIVMPDGHERRVRDLTAADGDRIKARIDYGLRLAEIEIEATKDAARARRRAAIHSVDDDARTIRRRTDVDDALRDRDA